MIVEVDTKNCIGKAYPYEGKKPDCLFDKPRYRQCYYLRKNGKCKLLNED